MSARTKAGRSTPLSFGEGGGGVRLHSCGLLVFTCWLVLALGSPAQTPPALEKLADGVYVFTTYSGTGKDVIPANGLLVTTSQGLVMVDTGWDTTAVKAVLQLAKQETKQSVTLALVTHAHIDRYGGIEAMRARGIKVVSTLVVARLAESLDITGIAPELPFDTTLTVGGTAIQVWYPGPGHSPDNIIVYVPRAKVLFGGCFIKSSGAKDLGNVEDADLREWDANLKRTLERYKAATIIVPGHGPAGGMELLSNTQKLLNAALPRKLPDEDEQE